MSKMRATIKDDLSQQLEQIENWVEVRITKYDRFDLDGTWKYDLS
jgi:hypothetical protein